jgi:hypothetical protein
MLRVYCDTGAYGSELMKYEYDGLISVHQFKYENANRHIRHAAVPSNPTWDEMKNYTWADLKKIEELRDLTWESVEHTSDKFNDIVALVGTKNLIDAKHLDSAVASGCTIFLTSDKKDIWSKREALKSLTGLLVLHVTTEWATFVHLVEKDDPNPAA